MFFIESKVFFGFIRRNKNMKEVSFRIKDIAISVTDN